MSASTTDLPFGLEMDEEYYDWTLKTSLDDVSALCRAQLGLAPEDIICIRDRTPCHRIDRTFKVETTNGTYRLRVCKPIAMPQRVLNEIATLRTIEDIVSGFITTTVR